MFLCALFKRATYNKIPQFSFIFHRTILFMINLFPMDMFDDACLWQSFWTKSFRLNKTNSRRDANTLRYTCSKITLNLVLEIRLFSIPIHQNIHVSMATYVGNSLSETNILAHWIRIAVNSHSLREIFDFYQIWNLYHVHSCVNFCSFTWIRKS